MSLILAAKNTAIAAIPGVAWLALATACVACDSEGEGEGVGSGGSTSGGSQGETETTGTTEGEASRSETEGPEPADPFAECRMLPAAAGWIEGEALESTAESTPQRISAAGAATWDLALDVLRAVDSSEASSTVASPASMYSAMGLAYGRWQGGQCGDRIATVMRFPELGDAIHNTIGATIRALESRSLPATQDVDPVVLTLRQSTWEFGTEELPEATGVRAIYGAKPNALLERGEAARELINCLIDVESDGLLPAFLPEGQPAPDTTSYDMNVSVLKAPWAEGMSARTMEFTPEDGPAGPVPGFGTEYVVADVFQGEAFTAVDLDFRGGEVSIMLVLPPQDSAEGLDAFAMSLDATTLQAARNNAERVGIEFAMPKVAINSGTLDFGPKLGFECEPFTLRSVFHGAVLELDEKGIKAAAATVAEGWEDGGPAAALSIEVDRPFLFFVHDAQTDFVLYSGRYAGE